MVTITVTRRGGSSRMDIVGGRVGALAAGLLVMMSILLLILIQRVVRKPAKRISSLENKHILITGASSGIGFALAEAALSQGGFVTLISKDPAKLHRAVQELKCEHGRILPKAVDVRNYEAISVAIKESMEWMPIDVIICNAGFARCAHLEKASIEDVDATVRTNLSGTLYSLHNVLPFMKQRSNRHPSSIVIMGSLASMHPIYGLATYTATKYALKGLADALKYELTPYNIHGTLVCPGLVETPMLDDVWITKKKYKTMKWVSLYRRRRAADPRKVAEITLEAAKKGTFLVTFDSLGSWISTLSRGGDPAESICRALFELIAFIPLRLSSFVFATFSYVLFKYCNNNPSNQL